ncbi:MAG: Spy/CpxP family protein refolding chaperone [Sulfuricaulis sp.]
MDQRKSQFKKAASGAMVALAIVTTIALTATTAIAANDSDADRINAHISDMHAKLKITKAEEDQWAKVADVMRDNAKKMDELTSVRMANAKTANAIDDLKSYGDLAEAHADGIKRFSTVFATLYASMPESQKAETDELFRNGMQHKLQKKK